MKKYFSYLFVCVLMLQSLPGGYVHAGPGDSSQYFDEKEQALIQEAMKLLQGKCSLDGVSAYEKIQDLWKRRLLMSGNEISPEMVKEFDKDKEQGDPDFNKKFGNGLTGGEPLSIWAVMPKKPDSNDFAQVNQLASVLCHEFVHYQHHKRPGGGQATQSVWFNYLKNCFPNFTEVEAYYQHLRFLLELKKEWWKKFRETEGSIAKMPFSTKLDELESIIQSYLLSLDKFRTIKINENEFVEKTYEGVVTHGPKKQSLKQQFDAINGQYSNQEDRDVQRLIRIQKVLDDITVLGPDKINTLKDILGKSKKEPLSITEAFQAKGREFEKLKKQYQEEKINRRRDRIEVGKAPQKASLVVPPGSLDRDMKVSWATYEFPTNFFPFNIDTTIKPVVMGITTDVEFKNSAVLSLLPRQWWPRAPFSSVPTVWQLVLPAGHQAAYGDPWKKVVLLPQGSSARNKTIAWSMNGGHVLYAIGFEKTGGSGGVGDTITTPPPGPLFTASGERQVAFMVKLWRVRKVDGVEVSRTLMKSGEPFSTNLLDTQGKIVSTINPISIASSGSTPITFSLAPPFSGTYSVAVHYLGKVLPFVIGPPTRTTTPACSLTELARLKISLASKQDELSILKKEIGRNNVLEPMDLTSYLSREGARYNISNGRDENEFPLPPLVEAQMADEYSQKARAADSYLSVEDIKSLEYKRIRLLEEILQLEEDIKWCEDHLR